MQVSTLNRHFRRLSMDRPALKRVVRKRYRLLSVEGAHVLWICDVWDGPFLWDERTGKKRRITFPDSRLFTNALSNPYIDKYIDKFIYTP